MTGCPQQGVEGYVKQIGEPFQGLNVRQGFSGLPVGHGLAGDQDPLRCLLLGEAVVLHQHLVALSFLHGAQVLPLEVLDHGQLGGLAVVGLDHHHGDLSEACQPGGPPAALAGNNLVVAGAELPDGQGLDDAVLTNGLRQLLQLLLIKVLPGLSGAALHLRNGQGGGRLRGVHGKIVTQQGAQALAEAGILVCHRVVPPFPENAYPLLLRRNSSARAV